MTGNNSLSLALNSTNGTYCPVSEAYKQYLLPLTYCVVLVFGLALNGTLLWQVCCRTKTWTCSVIYLLNLAVADLLYVLSLPLLIVSYAMDDVWVFGDFACKAVRFFFYTNLYCSINFLMCISVHRFLGVCFPLRSMPYRTKKLAILASAATWICVTTELLPTVVFARSGVINNMTVCYDLTSPDNFQAYFPYGVVLTITGFLIPFLIICACNCLMIKTLWRAEEKINVGKEIRRKSVRTITVVSLLFVLCFVPFHITRMIYLIVRVDFTEDCTVLNFVMLSYKIWRPIVSFNSCINPILYFTSTDSQRGRLLAQLGRNKVHPAVKSNKPAQGNNKPEIRTSGEKHTKH